jgi:putative redox protein
LSYGLAQIQRLATEVRVVEIEIHYAQELHCAAVHGPSARRLETDAPVDNQGKGGSFSPTDLVATALGTCMLTTMGIVARRKGWNVDGLDARVQKHMTQEPPRRIARLPVQIRVPGSIASALDAEARRELEHAARTCPVALSLHPAIEVAIDFDWG